MKINLIEWLVNEYNLDVNLLKKEIQYTFAHKDIGKYSDTMKCSDIDGLRRASYLIDRIFIWSHANKTFTTKFYDIDSNWIKFITHNKLLKADICIDFNFFKKEKLKIIFEGE